MSYRFVWGQWAWTHTAEHNNPMLCVESVCGCVSRRHRTVCAELTSAAVLCFDFLLDCSQASSWEETETSKRVQVPTDTHNHTKTVREMDWHVAANTLTHILHTCLFSLLTAAWLLAYIQCSVLQHWELSGPVWSLPFPRAPLSDDKWPVSLDQTLGAAVGAGWGRV